MSDEKDLHFDMMENHKEIHKNKKRISELEKKDILNLEEMKMFMGDVNELKGKYKSLLNGLELKHKEIAELRDEFKEKSEILYSDGRAIAKIREQLLELKEFAELTRKMGQFHSECQTIELNELKEDVKNCNVQDGEIATVLHLKTDNIKEVLRDHFEFHRLHSDEDSGLYKEMGDAIAKLDAGSKGKWVVVDHKGKEVFFDPDGSEKKEVCINWNGCCKLFDDHRDECEGVDKKCSNYKDSGGEKHDLKEYVGIIDSKPPELAGIDDLVEVYKPRENDLCIEDLKHDIKQELISEFVEKLKEMKNEQTFYSIVDIIIEEYEEKLK